MELTILIPVYNEEKTVEDILKRTTNLGIKKYEVIVVNDCSTDRSPKIIASFAEKFKSKQCTLRIVTHSKNLGKGSGIRTGLKYAKGRYFVVQDADLEYDPEDVLELYKEAKENNYDVVYGSRFMGSMEGMPRPNYYANRFYNFLLRFLYDTRITDMHTCYKMIKTPIIKSFKLQSAGFEYATELISNILSRSIVVHEVPIHFYGRTKKEGKKIDTKDGLRCIYLIIHDYLTFKGYLCELVHLSKFLVVGTIGFLTNLFLLSLIFPSFKSIVLSSTLSTIAAIHITFLLHDNWTYREVLGEIISKSTLRKRYYTYLLSNVIGAIISITLISVLTTIFKFDRILSLIVASLSVLIWNYTINKVFIWKSKIRAL